LAIYIDAAHHVCAASACKCFCPAFSDKRSTCCAVILLLLGFLPYTIFAVAWHRFVLLGPIKGDTKFVCSFERRHKIYFMVLAMFACTHFALMGVDKLFIAITESKGEFYPSIIFLFSVFSFILIYFFLRILFIFPAISVDAQ
jgi:hypothetical protein